MAKGKSDDNSVLSVIEIQRGRLECAILGTSPVILNRMSEKAKRELLMPRGRLTMADKATKMKHDPIAEYRASPYTLTDGPTLLGLPPISFKKGACVAALDIPGAKKAQIGRLVRVQTAYLPLWGIPTLGMSVVRSADMNRTPDIRTRAFVKEWATRITFEFVLPIVQPQSVANLLAWAGFTAGVGDWRQEKGSGSFGSYEIVALDDPRFLAVVETGGREAQQEAMDHPVAYDTETAELLTWYDVELADRRSRGIANASAPKKTRKSKPNGAISDDDLAQEATV